MPIPIAINTIHFLVSLFVESEVFNEMKVQLLINWISSKPEVYASINFSEMLTPLCILLIISASIPATDNVTIFG